MENPEEPKIIPFHSDFHRDVSLWLQNNRHLTHEERLAEVTFMMLLAKIDLDIPLLVHYAANCFTTMDALLKDTQEFPEPLHLTMIGTKKIADHLHSEGVRKSCIDANIARGEKFKPTREQLKQHWQANIDHNKKATDAAILLERTVIYNKAKQKPKRSTLEGYVRKWQALPK